jgi:hypothetical protein
MYWKKQYLVSPTSENCGPSLIPSNCFYPAAEKGASAIFIYIPEPTQVIRLLQPLIVKHLNGKWNSWKTQTDKVLFRMLNLHISRPQVTQLTMSFTLSKLFTRNLFFHSNQVA